MQLNCDFFVPILGAFWKQFHSKSSVSLSQIDIFTLFKERI